MMKKTKKKWNVHTAVTSSSEGQASSPSKGQASLLSERVNLFPCKSNKTYPSHRRTSEDMPSIKYTATHWDFHVPFLPSWLSSYFYFTTNTSVTSIFPFPLINQYPKQEKNPCQKSKIPFEPHPNAFEHKLKKSQNKNNLP